MSRRRQDGLHEKDPVCFILAKLPGAAASRLSSAGWWTRSDSDSGSWI